MKINNFNTTNLFKIYADQNKKAKADFNSLKSGGTDRVEISPKAKELFELKQKLSELPEVNVEKVERLKELIQNGEYEIIAEKIAKKLLE